MEADLVDMVREREIETSEHFDILNSLSDPNEIREWMLHGLPSDPNSHQSAVFMQNSNKWPLLIDP